MSTPVSDVQVGYYPYGARKSPKSTKLVTLMSSFGEWSAQHKPKHEVPCVSPHSSYVGLRTDATFEDHTGIHMVDVDSKVKKLPPPEELCKIFLEDGRVAAFGPSFSGKGIHIFFKLDPIPTNDEEQVAAKETCCEIVRYLGLTPDTGFNGMLNALRISSSTNKGIYPYKEFIDAKPVKFAPPQPKSWSTDTKDTPGNHPPPQTDRNWELDWEKFHKSLQYFKKGDYRHAAILKFARMVRTHNYELQSALSAINAFVGKYVDTEGRDGVDDEMSEAIDWSWEHVDPDPKYYNRPSTRPNSDKFSNVPTINQQGKSMTNEYEAAKKIVDRYEGKFMITPSKLKDIQVEESDWILPGFLRTNEINILPGQAGSGKTMFMNNLIYCSITGVPLMGVKIPPLKIALFDIDTNTDETKKHFKMIDNYHTRGGKVTPVDFWKEYDPEGIKGERLQVLHPDSPLNQGMLKLMPELKMDALGLMLTEKYINIIKGFDVLVIDSLINLVEGDATTSQTANDFIQGLNYFMYECGIKTAILLHHTTNNREKMAGSEVFRDRSRRVSLLSSSPFYEFEKKDDDKKHYSDILPDDALNPKFVGQDMITLSTQKPHSSKFTLSFTYDNFGLTPENDFNAIHHDTTSEDSWLAVNYHRCAEHYPWKLNLKHNNYEEFQK